MKRIALMLPLFLSLLYPAVAGSIPKEEVSADAKWLLHLDGGQFRASKVGGYIITEMLEKQLSRPVEEMKRNLKLDLDLGKILGGINSITIYGTDYQSPQDHAVLLIRTSPEIEKILVGFLAGMALAGTNFPVQVTQTQEGSVSFYAMQNTAYCAVLPGKVMAVGRSREITEKAAKVLAGKAPALTSGAAFGGFGDIKEAFFFLGVAEGFNAGPGLPPQAKLLQVADAGRVAVGEDSPGRSLRRPRRRGRRLRPGVFEPCLARQNAGGCHANATSHAGDHCHRLAQPAPGQGHCPVASVHQGFGVRQHRQCAR
jgi:hypothetical protein